MAAEEDKSRGHFEGEVLTKLEGLEKVTEALFQKLDGLPCSKHGTEIEVAKSRVSISLWLWAISISTTLAVGALLGRHLMQSGGGR